MKDLLLAHIKRHISLTNVEEEEFAGILSEKKVSKKSFLIESGVMVNELYYVVEGCLKAYYVDNLGNKHILQFAIEDWWITDFNALHNNIPAELYIEAIENCTVLAISTVALEELYIRIPKFERFFRILYTNAFIALRKRVMSSLHRTNSTRYLEFYERYPNIERRVTNYHIANYLGITAESLCRIRRDLGM